MDLTGMDVNFPVSEIVWSGYFNDPRLRSTPFHAGLFRSGRLGRKTGQGYYTYRDGKPVVAAGAADAIADGSPPAAVFIAKDDSAEDDALPRKLCDAAGVRVLDADDGRAPILIAPWGEDCTAAAHRLGLDHRRLVAIDPSGDTERRVTLMTAPGADPAARAAVAALVVRSGRAATAIADSPGFVTQRVCAMVMNLGCEIAQMQLAEPAAIDTAFRLGFNYPLGPLAMTDRWGAGRVYRIMTALQRVTGDDRYRPSQWLRRRALLGLSALTPG
jgi:3-hydroxybutyryl-CoA dehydrogenase